MCTYNVMQNQAENGYFWFHRITKKHRNSKIMSHVLLTLNAVILITHKFTRQYKIINKKILFFQEELERFERKQHGKKRRPRKQVEETVEPTWFLRHMFTILMVSLAAGLVSGLFVIAVT